MIAATTMNDANSLENFAEMNQVVRPPHRLFVCAWPAYIRPVLVFLAFIAVGFVMASFAWAIGTVWMLLGLVLFAYQLLMIRSIKLFTDDNGVWLYSGVFPWNRGVSGVKWRDLDEATYRQSFFSWAFKAFTVHIRHRFTKASEIVIPHIREGDEAVMHINRLQIQRLNTSHDADEPHNLIEGD